MEDWMGIYKGLRMPLLGLLLMAIAVYVYWPRNKKNLENPKHAMLEDELGANNE